MICWLLHRKEWLILIEGILPWHLDAVKFCAICDDGGQLPARVTTNLTANLCTA